MFGIFITSRDRKRRSLPYLEIDMPKTKLTEREINKLPAPHPTGKQTLYWDHGHKDALAGFAVLCSGITHARTYIVQRTLPDGRHRRLTVGAVNELSLEKARDKAADMLHELRHGVDRKKKIENPTLRETLETYLTARRDLRPASVALYRQMVEKTLTSWLDKPLREIDADQVEDRHRAIAAAISKGGVSDGIVTANVAMRTFRTLYNFAADRTADLPPNPVRRLRRQWFKEPKRERMVPEEKMAAFYAAVCKLPHAVQRDYLLMLMFTGMRRTECASLRWDDIDLSKRIISVQAKNTKTSKKLDLPMSDFVHDLLVARRALGNSGYLFPGKCEGRFIIGTTAPLKTVAEATGVQVSAHDLRRGFITIAESTDISVMALKALVNHTLGSGITEGYVQMKVERLREPVQRVANRIKELCGIVDVEGDNVKKLSRP
jgi:integrase